MNQTTPPENTESSKRQVAYKARIADIINNKYIKADGWLPNYIQVGGLKVSRVNILGVIVAKQTGDDNTQSFIIDDGTGRVALRFFTPKDFLNTGDIVTVIGRPREFGQERYIAPEIMKRVKDPKWAEVRKKELMLAVHEAAGQKEEDKEKEDDAEEALVETDDLTTDPRSRIIDAIKHADDGRGAELEEITVKAGVDNTEFWLKKLLESGDIFEVRPGRYKVLE